MVLKEVVSVDWWTSTLWKISSLRNMEEKKEFGSIQKRIRCGQKRIGFIWLVFHCLLASLCVSRYKIPQPDWKTGRKYLLGEKVGNWYKILLVSIIESHYAFWSLDVRKFMTELSGMGILKVINRIYK